MCLVGTTVKVLSSHSSLQIHRAVEIINSSGATYDAPTTVPIFHPGSFRDNFIDAACPWKTDDPAVMYMHT